MKTHQPATLLVAMLLLFSSLTVAPQGVAETPSKAAPASKAGSAPATRKPTEADYLTQVSIARLSGNMPALSKAYFQLGSYYQGQGQLSKARATYTEGLNQTRKKLPESHPMTGLLLCQLSTTYMYEQNFDKAVPLLDEGLGILQQNPQMGSMAEKLEGLRNIVVSFNGGLKALRQFDYPQAEASFEQALSLGTQAQEPLLISIAQSSLGISQLMQDKFEAAEISLAQAMEYSRKTKMTEARLMALMAYASLYTRQGKLETARMYYQDALAEPESVFTRISVPKSLFEQEISRLDHIQSELDQTTADINAPDYLPDVLWKKQVFHWNRENGDIRVYLEQPPHLEGWNPEYISRFKAACKQWQLALGDQVRFYFTEDPTDKADVTLHWTGEYNKLAGLTRCRHHGGKLTTAEITLNLKNYDNQLLPPESVYRLSLHEVGHLLGLMGHSRNPRDIMYPTLSMAKGLSSRDATTIRKLYAKPAKITNPARLTLSEYRKTAQYQSVQSMVEALNNH